jgi:hypothetical protein
VITEMSRKSGITSTTVCKILYKSLWLYSCKVGMPKKMLLVIFDWTDGDEQYLKNVMFYRWCYILCFRDNKLMYCEDIVFRKSPQVLSTAKWWSRSGLMHNRTITYLDPFLWLKRKLVNCNSYLDVLEGSVIPQIQVSQSDIIFQQNMVPSH